jgi:hypothetical protein
VIATIAPRPSARSAITSSSTTTSRSRPTSGETSRASRALGGHAEDLDRQGLALELELADRLEVERGLDLLRGGRADGDTPASGRGLQSRRGVDRVPEGVEPFLGRRAVVREEDDRPGVDSDPPGELHAVRLADVLRVRAERSLHPECRADGALGIVVVRARDAEQRVEAVAGELRNGAAEPLHLSDEQARHLVEEKLRALWPEPLADRRRIRDVREENRHDATLAFRPGHVAIIQCRHRSGTRDIPFASRLLA